MCVFVYVCINATVILKIDSVLRHLPTKKPSLVISHKQEEITRNLPKFFQKIEEDGQVPNSFCEASFTLILKPKI